MSDYADKREKILRTVQALLAQADHPNTSPTEAETFRNKAEALMFKFRIDEAMLGVEDKAKYSIKPVMREWFVAGSESEFYNQFYWLATECIRHVDGLYTYRWGMMEGQGHGLIVKAYGYESDLLFALQLFTACRITFSARLEPKVDPNESDEDNVYRLRQAGIERDRIAVLMGWAQPGDPDKRKRGKSRWADPIDVAEGVEAAKRLASGAMKASTLFKRACKARGEDPSILLGKGNSVATYRESFANGFVDQIRTRLWRLRNNRGQETGALVLKSRKADVEELFYTDYPERRPKAEGEAKYMPCARCAAAKSGYCRDHKPVKYKAKPVNLAAGQRGSEAANRVDLTGGDSPTGRMSGNDRRSLEG